VRLTVTLKHFILWFIKYFKSVLPDMSFSLKDHWVETRKYLWVRSVNDNHLLIHLKKCILLPPAHIQIHIQIHTQRQNTCQDAFILIKPTPIQRSRLTLFLYCKIWWGSKSWDFIYYLNCLWFESEFHIYQVVACCMYYYINVHFGAWNLWTQWIFTLSLYFHSAVTR